MAIMLLRIDPKQVEVFKREHGVWSRTDHLLTENGEESYSRISFAKWQLAFGWFLHRVFEYIARGSRNRASLRLSAPKWKGEHRSSSGGAPNLLSQTLANHRNRGGTLPCPMIWR